MAEVSTSSMFFGSLGSVGIVLTDCTQLLKKKSPGSSMGVWRPFLSSVRILLSPLTLDPFRLSEGFQWMLLGGSENSLAIEFPL